MTELRYIRELVERRISACQDRIKASQKRAEVIAAEGAEEELKELWDDLWALETNKGSHEEKKR